MTDEKKTPLMIEIIGEPEAGKTHFCYSMPEPVLIDTTPKQEGYFIAMKLFPDEFEKRYHPVRTMQDVRKVLIIAKEIGARSFCIDWGGDLLDLAATEWCVENKKKAVYPIVNYKFVHIKIIELFRNIAKNGMNIVLTAGFKDEYIGSDKSGKRERDGYRRMDFYSDVRLFLKVIKVGKHDDNSDMFVRIAKVVKNRFVDRTESGFIDKLPSLDYQGILDILPEFVRNRVII